jgi:hypothetical protein
VVLDDVDVLVDVLELVVDDVDVEVVVLLLVVDVAPGCDVDVVLDVLVDVVELVVDDVDVEVVLDVDVVLDVLVDVLLDEVDVLVDVLELVVDDVEVEVVVLLLVVDVAPGCDVDVVLDVLVDVVELVVDDVDVEVVLDDEVVLDVLVDVLLDEVDVLVDVLEVVVDDFDVDVVLDVLVDVVLDEVDVLVDVVELVVDEVDVEVVLEVLVVVVELVLLDVVVGGQPQVKPPFTTVAGISWLFGSARSRAVMLSATCCPRLQAVPPSARVSVTTGPLVPWMLPAPTLTTMTLISLPTAAAEQLNPVVRLVHTAEPATRLSSSGTSSIVKLMARTTTSGFVRETGRTMPVLPGAPQTSPTVTVVTACAGAAPATISARVKLKAAGQAARTRTVA